MITFGVDFDNTLVALDDVFESEAMRRGVVDPAERGMTRAQLRDRLRGRGDNETWMELQAHGYCAGLESAKPFDFAIQALSSLRARGARICIVSHKTRTPLRGPPVDLHEAARRWLRAHGICGGARAIVNDDDLFFEPSTDAKLSRIASLGCALFVDDLPSILAHRDFPRGAKRVLFDPNDEHACEAGCERARSWHEVETEALEELAAPMLESAGLEDAVLAPIAGGANNRVYEVTTPHGQSVLKAYYAGDDDVRDRLGTEWAFLEQLGASPARDLAPRPIARDAVARLGVYSRLDGHRPDAHETSGEARAIELIDFIARVNTPRPDRAPPASEACVSIAAHLDAVERRLARMAAIPADSIAAPIAHGLLPEIARGVIASTTREAEAMTLDLRAELSPDARILSPSDFGFHNALLGSDGRLRFVDFEYAGWDDPAKLVCDLFTRPEGAVPLTHLESVCAHMEKCLPQTRGLQARARLLLGVHAVKWAALALVEFLPGDSARRAFALGGDLDARKARQLEVARSRLELARAYARGPRR